MLEIICSLCGNISVDIKQDLNELASDLYRDLKEFNKKYKKCYEEGIQLWVVVEQKVTSLEELSNWKSKHGKTNGRFLIDMIHRLKISYGIRFKFVTKLESPKVLLDILQKNIT